MAFVDLNDSVIAQVRSAADIVDFVGQVTPLKLAGKSYKGLCPFHREKTPSFHVDRDKGLFYCFGCGTGGDVFKFLSLTERFTFPEAVEHVVQRLRRYTAEGTPARPDVHAQDVHHRLDGYRVPGLHRDGPERALLVGLHRDHREEGLEGGAEPVRLLQVPGEGGLCEVFDGFRGDV